MSSLGEGCRIPYVVVHIQSDNLCNETPSNPTLTGIIITLSCDRQFNPASANLKSGTNVYCRGILLVAQQTILLYKYTM